MASIDVSARTPEDISAIRAGIFLSGADEIVKIDQQSTGRLNRGLIATPIEAIKDQLKGLKKVDRAVDPRVVEVLTQASEATYGVRIRNRDHLCSFLLEKLGTDICYMKRPEREKIVELIRAVAKKLTNGHAGTWI